MVRRSVAATVLLCSAGWLAVATSGSPIAVVSAGASQSSSTVAPTTTTGGGTTTSSTAPTSTTSTTTTTAPPAPTTTAGGKAPPQVTLPDRDPALLAAAAARYCALSAGYLEQIRLIEISLSSPDRLRELMESAAPAATESAGLAAREVQPDVAKVSGTLGELRAAFEAAGYQLAKLPPELVTKFQGPAFREPLARVQQFAAKAC